MQAAELTLLLAGVVYVVAVDNCYIFVDILKIKVHLCQ